MSLIRPEARAVLWRWRDVLIGAALIVAATPTAIGGFGVRRAFAVIALCLAAALIWQGIRRARFPASDGGPGLVEIDERQVSYFGPYGGGAISLDDLSRVVLHRADGTTRWEFTTKEAERLSIPTDAAGVEGLYDALAALPGADHAAIRQAMTTGANGTFLVWTAQKAVH